MTIEILPVSDKAMLRRFIRVPSDVHKGDAAWITPLTMEREEAFSPKTNPFLRPDSWEIRKNLAMENDSDVAVFGEIRQRKDNF